MNIGLLQTLSWRDVVEIVETANSVYYDELRAGRDPRETYPNGEAYYRAVVRKLRNDNNQGPPADERFPKILQAAENVVGKRLTDTRSKENTLIRALVAYRMHKEGYTHHETGIFLKRDHATITYLYFKIADMQTVPQAYRTELSMLEKFEEVCEE